VVKQAFLTFVFVVCFGLGGCGTSSSGGIGGGTPPPAGVAGKWEIIFTSTQNPSGSYPHTAIETNLTQAGSSTFAGDQATFVIPFGALGIDQPVGPLNPCGGLPQAAINGTLSGQNLSFTLIEIGSAGSYTVTGTATISSDGHTISGSYTAPAACGIAADAGTLNGTLVPFVSGTYATVFDTGPGPTMTITEDSTHNLTVTGIYQGSSFTLSGAIVGGFLALSGNIPGLGGVIYIADYLNPPLVSLVPAVNGMSTQAGEFLIFGPGASIGLATKQ